MASVTMVVTYILGLQVALVFGQDTMLVQNQELLNNTRYGGSNFFIDGRHLRLNGTYCNSTTFLPPGTSSVFTSPGFPNPYPSIQICQYLFKSLDRGCNIQIECSSFQLPSSSECSSSANFFMKWGFARDERKTFCGYSSPPTVVSSSYWAYAKFTCGFNFRRYLGFNCTASTICPTTALTTMTTSRLTTTDIDECWTNNGGCNQTCTNTDGSFHCSCSSGYSLSNDRKSCTDIDECWSNNGGCNQTCTNTDGSFYCSCSSGYSLSNDKKSCTDIDECWSNNGGCNQTCTNTDGSFYCFCSSGYSLSNDKKSCNDIDECWSNNGGCNQTCTNTDGSFYCSCSSVYLLSNDKKSCTDIDECLSNNGGCNQTCTNTDGSFHCSCSSGYSLSNDRKSCTDIDECLSSNGGCNQTCTNTDGSFHCSCSSGYSLSYDKKSCTVIPPTCKAKQNCKEANGMCKKRNKCSGDKIRNGCKGGKGDCVCCLDKPPPCKSKRKCREAKGVCQKTSKCSDKEIKIKSGCKDGTGCICCVEKDCPEFCNDIYEPVCGNDEKTYSNLCELRQASCIKKDVSPVPLYNGICGKDNHTT